MASIANPDFDGSSNDSVDHDGKPDAFADRYDHDRDHDHDRDDHHHHHHHHHHPCFLAGTAILTVSGEVKVEELRLGDQLTTLSGVPAIVRWIGRRKVTSKFADPMRALPIRIKAGALADKSPSRDLFVSPDHAIFLDDILIQAGALVNGVSIIRDLDAPPEFNYHHIEADKHVLIFAEGVAAETFVDNLDRMAFDNWEEHLALYPNGNPIAELSYPRAKAHRQVPISVREKLAERAVALYGARISTAA